MLLERLQKTHKQLKLKYEGNEEIYRYWAEMTLRFEIVGKPRAVKSHQAKEKTLVSRFTANVRFFKQSREWNLLDWPTQRFVDHLVGED